MENVTPLGNLCAPFSVCQDTAPDFPKPEIPEVVFHYEYLYPPLQIENEWGRHIIKRAAKHIVQTTV